MLLSPSFQQRIKHFDLLLAKELSLIEREHVQNLLLHQKLENSIRRSNQSTTTTTTLINHRNQMSIHFDHIYNERHRSLDYHNVISCDENRSQVEIETINSLEDISRENLLERRRKSMKTCHLPPIIKANMNERLKREDKYRHCLTNVQSIPNKLQTEKETLTVIHDGTKKTNQCDGSPIQKQVRSFLETLPSYKGVQKGFDSFAATSLYSFRKPINVR